jgi:GLPGLI family protein
MKLFLIANLLFAFAIQTNAQNIFISKGKIEFEKKVNVHKQIDADSEGDEGGWAATIKKTTPQYKISYFDLYFDENKTLYKPGREVLTTQRAPDWITGPASDNTIYNDLAQQIITAQKNVFENTFLIQDSARKIDWRITPDIRTIAGFECRKAVGRIMDSVYVIAFYSEQIIPSSGPESFAGLPGMIMGVAIPRINTTWFASKLELVAVKQEDLAAPKKGKKVTNKQLMELLKPSMKDWGKYGQKNIWLTML